MMVKYLNWKMLVFLENKKNPFLNKRKLKISQNKNKKIWKVSTTISQKNLS